MLSSFHPPNVIIASGWFQDPVGLRGHCQPAADAREGAGAGRADCPRVPYVDPQSFLQLRGRHGGLRKGTSGSCGSSGEIVTASDEGDTFSDTAVPFTHFELFINDTTSLKLKCYTLSVF